jgi:glucosamine kinase
MILLADSGSSKTHWVLKSNDGLKEFHTKGINPFFVTPEFVQSELDVSGIGDFKSKISKIIFYGASCSSDDRKQYIHDIFQSYFPNVRDIMIDHDMVASCIALFGNKPGIACIIGTGSNSCVWNGHEITANVPALGYILGDEASGASMGKEILKHYIYKTFPVEIQDYIYKEYGLKKDDIFNAVYKGELPNRFLASFSRVASAFREVPSIQQIIRNGFQDFIQFHIICYPESKTLPIGSVGSISEVFREEFESELAQFNLNLNLVVKEPIGNLVKFHFG